MVTSLRFNNGMYLPVWSCLLIGEVLLVETTKTIGEDIVTMIHELVTNSDNNIMTLVTPHTQMWALLIHTRLGWPELVHHRPAMSGLVLGIVSPWSRQVILQPPDTTNHCREIRSRRLLNNEFDWSYYIIPCILTYFM